MMEKTSDPGYLKPSTTGKTNLWDILETTRVNLPPNRFDPYEALDIINQMGTNGGKRLTHSGGERLITLDELNTIHVQVNLLRAYITGMEK